MKLKKIFVLVTVLILTFSYWASGHEKKWPEKRLRQAWTTAQSFTSKQISLSPDQISQLTSEGLKIGSEDRSPIFYFAQENAKTVGIIIFIDEYGTNGKMEISVAMGADGKIKKIDLWEHSENLLVAKDDFLKQFQDKTAKDFFVVSKDYQAISDAKEASEAVARAAKKALKITNIIFERK